MRRIALWLMSTVAAVVLLFSYRTSTHSTSGPSTVATGTATNTGAGADTGAGTYDGSVAQTTFGPVQVRITVADGQVTDVTVLTYPDRDRRDAEINSYALPILRQAALQAQSAEIDTVSGATATSDGYRESLQAALDAANL